MIAVALRSQVVRPRTATGALCNLIGRVLVATAFALACGLGGIVTGCAR